MKNIEIVLEIISGNFGKKPRKISPLVGKGSVNEIFVVETEKAKLVVRMNDAKFFDEYEKEVWSASRASEKKIPVSEILTIGIFGESAYSIQKFIEGTEGRDLPARKNHIWEKLGSYARRIHQIEVAGFGLKFSDLIEGNAEKSWLEYLDYNVESLHATDELLKLEVLTETQSEEARKIFENLKSKKFEFGLNHGDLSLKNTIVDRTGIVHLIDWGSAEASIVPHHELIQLLKMNMLENDPENGALQMFLEGYGITNDEFEMMLPDLKALTLLRAFDKLRWALDWKIANPEDYIFEAKETVSRFLS